MPFSAVSCFRGQASARAGRQVLADGQQGGLGTLLRVGGVAPLGAAHRAQEHRVAGLALLSGAVWVGLPHRVDGAAAHQNILKGEGVAELLAHRLHDLDGLPHDLGADAVAPDHCNFLFHLFLPLIP